MPIVFLYHNIQKYYTATLKQLRRLETQHQSFLYSTFAETISGLATIKAFDAEDRFRKQFNNRLDTFQRCFAAKEGADRWLGLWLELISHLILISAVGLSMFASSTSKEGGSLTEVAFDDAFVGLIISMALPLTITLTYLIRCQTAIQKNILAVERIEEYCQVEVEENNMQKTNDQLPKSWPNKGKIEFINYCTSYNSSNDQPLALKNINLIIEDGEKVGIVGRTGAGKSTLALALFRILEAEQGFIKIDGIDISTVKLEEFRRRLAIIPQDPVSFEYVQTIYFYFLLGSFIRNSPLQPRPFWRNTR